MCSESIFVKEMPQHVVSAPQSAVVHEPADWHGWSQPGQKAARCQRRSQKHLHLQRSPGEGESPLCSFLCLLEGHLIGHTGKHHGSPMSSLSDQIFTSWLSPMLIITTKTTLTAKAPFSHLTVRELRKLQDTVPLM